MQIPCVLWRPNIWSITSPASLRRRNVKCFSDGEIYTSNQSGITALTLCFLSLLMAFALTVPSETIALEDNSEKALKEVFKNLDTASPGKASMLGFSKVACKASPNAPVYTASFCWRGNSQYVTGLFKSVDQHFDLLPSIDIFGVRSQHLNPSNQLGYYFEMGKAQYEEREKNHWILNGGISHALSPSAMVDINFLSANELFVSEWGMNRTLWNGQWDSKLFLGSHSIQGYSMTGVMQFGSVVAELKQLSYSGIPGETPTTLWMELKPFKHLAEQKSIKSLNFKIPLGKGLWEVAGFRQEKNFTPSNKYSLVYSESKSLSAPKDLLLSTGLNSENQRLTALLKLTLKLQ